MVSTLKQKIANKVVFPLIRVNIKICLKPPPSTSYHIHFANDVTITSVTLFLCIYIYKHNIDTNEVAESLPC